ncbi:hypothetical protein [Mycolicibacterium mageritense]|uniref:Uncharacterized protein n=1 Tax=Mycolicibacterium mageritense TaxID=53462 RepID=A0AAI8TY52_MYCME|nr:hypothetical protein [Mycolicibacterium mageritense]BDY33138.1 hypothetical protein hbim_07113 [Mycolicibacterium mageritense]
MARADDDDDDDEEVFPDEDYIPIRPVDGGRKFLNEDYAPLGRHDVDDVDQPAPQQSQIRTVVISVVATLVVLAVGWFGWQKYSEHQAAEKTEQLSEWVEQSMREKLGSDTELAKYGIQVTSVDLIRVSDTKYEGMASVTTNNDRINPRQVSINVTADGDRMMWQAAPGAFLFLVQDALSNIPSP